MNAWDLSCRTAKLPLGHLDGSWTSSNHANNNNNNNNITISSNNYNNKHNTMQTATIACPNDTKLTVFGGSNSTSVPAAGQQFLLASPSPISPFIAYPSINSSLSSPFNLSLSNSPASSSRSVSGISELSDDIRQTIGMAFVARNGSTFEISNNKAFDAGQSTSSSSLDRKARKKDQNRRAAYNYRCKKMEEKNRMREEEMRLVYSRVCLIGYAEELDSSIMYILSTKTKKTLDKDGNPNCFLCPICLQSCDNTLNLRSHINHTHYPLDMVC